MSVINPLWKCCELANIITSTNSEVQTLNMLTNIGIAMKIVVWCVGIE